MSQNLIASLGSRMVVPDAEFAQLQKTGFVKSHDALKSSVTGYTKAGSPDFVRSPYTARGYLQVGSTAFFTALRNVVGGPRGGKSRSKPAPFKADFIQSLSERNINVPTNRDDAIAWVNANEARFRNQNAQLSAEQRRIGQGASTIGSFTRSMYTSRANDPQAWEHAGKGYHNLPIERNGKVSRSSRALFAVPAMDRSGAAISRNGFLTQAEARAARKNATCAPVNKKTANFVNIVGGYDARPSLRKYADGRWAVDCDVADLNDGERMTSSRVSATRYAQAGGDASSKNYGSALGSAFGSSAAERKAALDQFVAANANGGATSVDAIYANTVRQNNENLRRLAGAAYNTIVAQAPQEFATLSAAQKRRYGSVDDFIRHQLALYVATVVHKRGTKTAPKKAPKKTFAQDGRFVDYGMQM